MPKPSTAGSRTIRRRLAAAVLCAVTVAGVPPAAAQSARVRPDDTYVTNGPVHAIAAVGDTIYVGGRFDRVGPRTGPGVQVDLDGTRNPDVAEIAGAGPTALAGAGGSVTAVAADGSGGWYVAGLFTHVGGSPRVNVAHILADGSVDQGFNPAVNDAVSSVVVSGSTVYLAGRFTSISGQARNHIGAVDAADGSVTAFNPNANAPVEALAVSDDGATVYAGGRFTVIGGLPRLSLAALSADGGAATPTFSPAVTGTLGNGVVDAIALSGSTLYVGGSFNSVGGLPRDNIAAVTVGLPLDGVPVPGFNASPSRSGCAACGSVAALAVAGSTVYAGGMFDSIGGQRRTYLAGLDAATGSATPFDPAPNGNIFALTVAGATVYASGGFRSIDGGPSIGGQARNYAAALDAVDGSATGFDPNPNAVVSAIAVSDDAVYLGGHFSSLGGEVRNGIAALDATDGTPTAFDPDARGFNGGAATVYALAVNGGTVYAGGYFGQIGGQSRGGLAALDAVDGSATDWDPSARYGTGPAVIQAVEVASGAVYAGGVFTTIGGEPRNNVAALDPVDGSATSWNPDSNSVVETLVAAGDVIYAGGHFTRIGGQTRNKIAALDVVDGTATSWNPDATSNGNVLAIAVSGSTVYAGGNFPSIGGVARTNLAGIDADTAAATAFDPRPGDPMSGGGVHALAVHGSTVYAAGFFTQVGGQTRHLVAGLRAADGTATDFDPMGPAGFGAFALATSQDKLYVGGSFDTFDLARQQGFAQFSLGQ